MHILITGGAGFIGSTLAEYYLNKGYKVSVIDNLSTGRKENIASFLAHSNFNFIHADLYTYTQLPELVETVDCVFHFASIVGALQVLKEAAKVISVNLGITQRLMDAIIQAKRQPRVIIASTSEVYGNANRATLKEDDDLIINYITSSRSSYAVSKVAIESYCLALHKQHAIPVTVLRLFNTIGCNQTGKYGMVVPNFIKQALANQTINIHGTGEQRRCFIDVRDSVNIIDAISNNDNLLGQIINVGNDKSISINQLAMLVKELAMSKSEIKHISYIEAYGEDICEFMQRKPDLTKLKQTINYEFQWDLEKTLVNLLQHFRGQNG